MTGSVERSPRVRGPIALLAVAGAVALAVGGCGQSDEQRVEETVKRFYRASAEGDGREACAQLHAAALGGAGLAECQASIEQLGQLGGPETRRRIDDVHVRDTRVSDDRATTQAQIAGQTPKRFQLLKVDGEWKLESLGSFGAAGA